MGRTNLKFFKKQQAWERKQTKANPSWQKKNNIPKGLSVEHKKDEAETTPVKTRSNSPGFSYRKLMVFIIFNILLQQVTAADNTLKSNHSFINLNEMDPEDFAQALNDTYKEFEKFPNVLYDELAAIEQMVSVDQGNITEPSQQLWVTPQNTASIGLVPNQMTMPTMQQSFSGQLYQRSSDGCWIAARNFFSTPFSTFVGLRWVAGFVNGFSTPLQLKPLLNAIRSAQMTGDLFNNTRIPAKNSLISIDSIDGEFNSLLDLLDEMVGELPSVIFRFNPNTLTSTQLQQIQQQFGADRILVSSPEVAPDKIKETYKKGMLPALREPLTNLLDSETLEKFVLEGGRWLDLNFLSGPRDARKLAVEIANLQFQFNEFCRHNMTNPNFCHNLQSLKSVMTRFAREFSTTVDPATSFFSRIFQSIGNEDLASIQQSYKPPLNAEDYGNLFTHLFSNIALLSYSGTAVRYLFKLRNEMPPGAKKKLMMATEYALAAITEALFLFSNTNLFSTYVLDDNFFAMTLIVMSYSMGLYTWHKVKEADVQSKGLEVFLIPTFMIPARTLTFAASIATSPLFQRIEGFPLIGVVMGGYFAGALLSAPALAPIVSWSPRFNYGNTADRASKVATIQNDATQKLLDNNSEPSRPAP